MLELDINLLFTVIDVLILFFALRKFLFKPVRRIMEERKNEIDQSYAEAEKTRQEAASMKSEYDRTMQELDEKKEQSVAEAKAQAGREYDRILAQAKNDSDELIEKAKKQAQAQTAQEKQKANEEISSMVKDAAAKIAESESDKSLYDAFLNQVETRED